MSAGADLVGRADRRAASDADLPEVVQAPAPQGAVGLHPAGRAAAGADRGPARCRAPGSARRDRGGCRRRSGRSCCAPSTSPCRRTGSDRCPGRRPTATPTPAVTLTRTVPEWPVVDGRGAACLVGDHERAGPGRRAREQAGARERHAGRESRWRRSTPSRPGLAGPARAGGERPRRPRWSPPGDAAPARATAPAGARRRRRRCGEAARWRASRAGCGQGVAHARPRRVADQVGVGAHRPHPERPWATRDVGLGGEERGEDPGAADRGCGVTQHRPRDRAGQPVGVGDRDAADQVGQPTARRRPGRARGGPPRRPGRSRPGAPDAPGTGRSGR